MTSNCGAGVGATPIGIQRLVSVERVIVHQQSTMFTNKYRVCTPEGELVLDVKEECSALAAMLGGASRGFHMDMYDTAHNKVITVRRPHTFGPSKVEVCVLGALASIVRQEATLMKPVLSIRDARDQPVLRVKGPISVAYECDFELQTLEKQRIGAISKQWGGVMKEMFTQADQFLVSFPRDLDVRYKAATIAAALLISAEATDIIYGDKHVGTCLSKKKKKSEEEQKRKFLNVCTECTAALGNNETDIDAFGKFVTKKLEKIQNAEQKMYAE